MLSPVNCTPQSSERDVKSLRRSKRVGATDTQQRIQDVAVSDTGEADSKDTCVEDSGIIKDTESVAEETLASHYSAADDSQSQSLLSEDESEMYSTRHCDQREKSDMSVDRHGGIDSSLLSESSAGNKIDNSSVQLLNAHDFHQQHWEGRTNMSTEGSVCSEKFAEDCAGTSEHSKRCTKKQSSKLPMTVTFTADVHAQPPETPLLSPPLFSDTSFAGEEDGMCSQPSQSNEESAEEVDPVGDLGPVFPQQINLPLI